MNPSRFLKSLGALALLISLVGSITTPVQAVVLFQDDIFGDVMSDTVRIGSNDAGAVNTSIQFGNDATASENGNITWSISTNTFNFDHGVTITGSLDASGAVDFSGSTQFRIREDSDPNTNSDCTAIGELIFNNTTNQLMRCTATGTPGTWTNVDTTGGSSDFEAVYTNDADKVLTTSNGIFTVNTGTNDFVVDSNDWNVTAAGDLNAVGVEGTGSVNFSGSTGFRIREDADPNTNAACASIGELIFNTTTNQLMRCSTIGGPGVATWNDVDTTGGSSDFEAVYGNDADKVLTTSNGNFTIDSGTGDTIIDSNDWNVTAAGALDAASITSNGTLTATATTNLNGTSNIGDGGDDVVINSNDWDISSAGVVTGLTGITSTGVVDFSAASSFRIREVADESTAACTTVKEILLDTTENRIYVCTVVGAPGTWVGVAAGDANTLDTIDSTQFLRSDTSDNFTSGTLTLENGTTLSVGGVAQIGDGGDDVFINSNDWDISSTGVATGFTGITSTGTISLGDNSGTVVFDGTNFDVTSAGAVTLTGNLALSGDAGEGVSGGGLVDCDATSGRLQWDATTNKFSCLTVLGPDTSIFVDTTPVATTDSDTTELFDDATRPNITTDSTSSTVQVSVSVLGLTVDADDQIAFVRIIRETDGTNPSCAGDPQVGDVFGSWTTFVSNWTATATFLDSPGVAGNIRYTVCSSSSTVNGGDFDGGLVSVRVSLVELGN